jgi:hypothetical protein
MRRLTSQVVARAQKRSIEPKKVMHSSFWEFLKSSPSIFPYILFFLYFHIFFLSHRRPFCSSTVAVGFKMVNEPNKSKFNNISNCSCKELYSLSYIADMYNG